MGTLMQDPSNSSSQNRGFIVPSLCIIGIRLLILMVGIFAYHQSNSQPHSIFRGDYPLFAWDAIHYQEILQNGYPAGPSIPSNIAFFPLYPILAYPLSLILGAPLALLLVSNLSSILGALITYFLLRDRLGHFPALGSVLLLSCYPQAFFFSAPYTEGLFLFFVASTLWLVEHKKFWPAIILAGLGSALRPTGAILSVLLILRIIQLTAGSPLRWSVIVIWSLLSVSGALVYQGYLTARYRQFNAYFAAQKNWDSPQQTPAASPQTNPASSPDETTRPAPKKQATILNRVFSPGLWTKISAIAILALAIAGLVKPDPLPRLYYLLPIGIFLLGFLPGWGARYFSIARFETAAIPCFALLGFHIAKKPWLLAALSLIGLVCQAFLCAAYANGAWTG